MPPNPDGRRRGTRPPPDHDFQAEATVIGCCLLDQGAAATAVAELDAHMFNDERCRLIFEVIMGMMARGDQVDIHTVSHALRARNIFERAGTAEFLEDCREAVPDPRLIRGLIGIVRGFATGRHLKLELRKAYFVVEQDPADEETHQDAIGRVLVAYRRDQPDYPPRRSVPARREYPLHALPEVTREYVEEVRASIGSDPGMAAPLLLAAQGAAIGNSRNAQIKDDWIEPAVLWVAGVSDSGDTKSPTHDATMAFSRDQDRRLTEKQQEAMRRFERQNVIYKADLATWKRDRKKEPNLQPPNPPEQPPDQRAVVSDLTCEALTRRLASSPRGLLAERDELGGWFRGHNEYKGSGADVDRWISLHGAREVRVDRAGKSSPSVFVRRGFVAIAGMTQPSALKRNLSDPLLFDQGLVARFLVVTSPNRPQFWSESTISAPCREALAVRFRDLYALGFDAREDDPYAPVPVPLTAEAKRVFVQFVNEHAEETASESGRIAIAWAKFKGYAARIALILQVTRDPKSTYIDDRSMRDALLLVGWHKHETRRVYALLEETQEQSDQRRLIEFIEQKGGRVAPRDLISSLRRFKDDASPSQAAHAALNQLVFQGFGEWVDIPPGPRGGRPGRQCVLFVSGTGTPSDSPPRGAATDTPLSAEPKPTTEPVEEVSRPSDDQIDEGGAW